MLTYNRETILAFSIEIVFESVHADLHLSQHAHTAQQSFKGDMCVMPCFTAYASLQVMLCVACDMLFGACHIIVGTAWLKS